MLGKASEIKTLSVFETQYEKVHEVVNRALRDMGDTQVLDISYSSTLSGQRYWGSALIIYKEELT
jgi:hypothetical protein